MYRIPGAITLFSIIVLSWGWCISESDGSQFARAGALVTALSLAFMFWHYGQLLDETEILVTEELRDELAAMNVRQGLTQAVGLQLEKHVHAGRNRTERYITRWQAVIVAVGTLVWGFGDLVFQYKGLAWNEIFLKLIYLGAQSATLGCCK